MWGIGMAFALKAIEIEKRNAARRRRQRRERIRAWMDKYEIPFALKLLRNYTIAAALFAAVVFLTGCQGHQAMRWKDPPPVKNQCAIVVCESRMGRIDPKRDCTKCADSIGDIL
jgi:hypothetical protein